MSGCPAQTFDAGWSLDAYGLMALALARKLTEMGYAQIVEDQMVALVDPIYDTLTNSTAAMRLVDFCDGIRRITGLPELPEDRTADG